MGVCKRWANVYWSSTALWRHLTVSLEEPLVLSPSPPLIMFQEAVEAHRKRRLAGWQAAKRAQLQRVGHLVEAATFRGTLQISALLPLLSPALGALKLPFAREEQALLLPRFSQLTSLEIALDQGLGPVLPQLAALQRLKIGSGDYGTQFLQALRPLSNLTHLVGCALIVPLGALQAWSAIAGWLVACSWCTPRAHTAPPPSTCPHCCATGCRCSLAVLKPI